MNRLGETHRAMPTRSLRRTLLLGLSAGLLLALLLATLFVYRGARQQADEVFDYQLRQLAAALPSVAFAPLAPGRTDLLDAEEDIVIRIWDAAGELLYDSHGPELLAPRTALGFADVNGPGGTWRAYGVQLGDTVVQVAQPMAARQRLAAKTAIRAIAPMLVLLPLGALFVWLTVGRALSPVRKMATDVSTRDASTLQPLALDDLPDEIRPLGAALNDLLGRLAVAIAAQRAFVADAAHELRTPLTALGLQVQLARRASDAVEREQAFADLSAGLARANRLVQQLLTLARQEASGRPAGSSQVDLSGIVRDALADIEPIAAQSGVALELSLPAAPVLIDGDADALRILVTNLLDNAWRHGALPASDHSRAPVAGSIDVSLLAGAGSAPSDGDARVPAGRAARLTIRDHGPGIDRAERSRVFDRFYRVPGTLAAGSGLGLSIVHHIAQRHGARITLEDAAPGLKVQVDFPDRGLGHANVVVGQDRSIASMEPAR